MGVKRRKPPKRGYQHRLTTALGSLDLPAVGVGRVSVFHDPGCALLAGKGGCNCTPDISISTGDGQVAVVDPDGSVSRVKQSATLKQCSPPFMTIWTVPEDDQASHQFVLCHIMDDDHLPAAARHPLMMVGQTPNRPYPQRQKVLGDYDAMTSQGAIAPHSLENLGALDRGVSLFRRLLREGIRDVQAGKDPKGLIRATEPQAMFGSDLVVPASAVAPQGDERTTLMAFAQSTLDGYLTSPPFRDRSVPKPPPLPVLAAAE